MFDLSATIIGSSDWAKSVRNRVASMAASADCVLLSGPPGSGKSSLARALHEAGPRRAHPLMALDCALLPGTLIFGEAFGHGSGGMVSGVGAALGAFRAATGGTVVLENIDQTDLFSQRHVQLALCDRHVTPLGTTTAVPFSSRVVATTELELQAEVAAGRFDLGLFLELEPRHIRLPGLQQRSEDLQALAGHFLGELCGDAAPRVEFSPAALEWLRSYEWPGNVRELKSFMGRVVACRPNKSGVTELDLTLVRQLLCPSPFTGNGDHAYTERIRFPGLTAQRLVDEGNCRRKFAIQSRCGRSR